MSVVGPSASPPEPGHLRLAVAQVGESVALVGLGPAGPAGRDAPAAMIVHDQPWAATGGRPARMDTDSAVIMSARSVGATPPGSMYAQTYPDDPGVGRGARAPRVRVSS